MASLVCNVDHPARLLHYSTARAPNRYHAPVPGAPAGVLPGEGQPAATAPAEVQALALEFAALTPQVSYMPASALSASAHDQTTFDELHTLTYCSPRLAACGGTSSTLAPACSH